METLLKDFRHTWRSLWLRPLLTVTALFATTLGLGTNTAVFSVVNVVLQSRCERPNPIE
jgi:hypothetical protein